MSPPADTVYNYTTDSLAVAAILRANGWGMPIIDSSSFVARFQFVDSLTDTADGRIVGLHIIGVLVFLYSSAFGYNPYPPTNISPEIGNLTALKILEVSANKLDSLPPEIRNLTNLTYLDCSINFLSTLPAEIGNLKKLQELYLRSNLLTGLPGSAGNFSEMWGMQVDDNRLTRLPPEIGGWTSLEYFSCFWNPLTTLPPEIGKLGKLSYLDLDGCALDSIPNEIGSCESLGIVYLEENNLSSLPDSIVKLNCNIWLDSNHICSDVPCPIQRWLVQNEGANWAQRQRCSAISLPPCDSNAVKPRPTVGLRLAARSGVLKLYDLQGRSVGGFASRQLSRHGNLRGGVYIVKSVDGSAISRRAVLRN